MGWLTMYKGMYVCGKLKAPACVFTDRDEDKRVSNRSSITIMYVFINLFDTDQPSCS